MHQRIANEFANGTFGVCVRHIPCATEVILLARQFALDVGHHSLEPGGVSQLASYVLAILHLGFGDAVIHHYTHSLVRDGGEMLDVLREEQRTHIGDHITLGVRADHSSDRNSLQYLGPRCWLRQLAQIEEALHIQLRDHIRVGQYL